VNQRPTISLLLSIDIAVLLFVLGSHPPLRSTAVLQRPDIWNRNAAAALSF